MELSDNLKKEAVMLGLCNEHTAAWNYETKEQLLEYYKRNPDWCFERNYPSINILKENFDEKELSEMDIYINRDISVDGFKSDIIFLRECEGEILINEYEVKRFYLSNCKNLTFNISKNSILILDCYDKNEIVISNKIVGNVKVYDYGSSNISEK